MSNKIFVIKNDTGIISFYDDLEKAKNDLKKIYEMTADFKFYEYKINVYDLVDNKYELTNVSYTYRFDVFSIHQIGI
jgi:hypothetical protein